MPASRGARSATIWDQWKARKLYHAGVVAKGNFRGSQGRDRPGRRVRDLLGHNSLAGASYAVFFALCGFEGVTGFALLGASNPGGFLDTAFGWTTPLLGGGFLVHTWHHLAAWFIIIIAIFHLYIVLYGSILHKDGLVDSIFSGEKHSIEGDKDANTWIS